MCQTASNEQILDSISTLDIVKELSKRQGIVCSSVESERIATMFIAGQDNQDGIIKFCSERFAELNRQEVAANA